MESDETDNRTVRAFQVGSPPLEIHHIDVGYGDATLIVAPNGQTILIDGGDVGQGMDVVAPYLRDLGIRRLDYLFASHMATPHIGGLSEVLDEVRVRGSIWDNGSTAETAEFSRYRKAAERQPVGGRAPALPGMAIDLGADATATVVLSSGHVLGGKHVKLTEEADRGVGLLVQSGCFDYVIAADIGGGGSAARVEQALAPMVGNVDVMRVNRHGGPASTSLRWVNRLRAEVAVISVGPNPLGHPAQKTLDRLLAKVPGVRAAPATVYQTGAGSGGTGGIPLGTVVVRVDSNFYTVNDSHVFAIDTSGACEPMGHRRRFARLEVVPGSFTLRKSGQSLALRARRVYTDGDVVDVTTDTKWKVSDPGVARVDADGTLIAEAEGTVAVSARHQGVSGEAKVEVHFADSPVEALFISPSRWSLRGGGDQEPLRAFVRYKDGRQDEVTSLAKWSSSKPEVATVNGEGVVESVDVGSTRVTVSYKGMTAEAKLLVRNEGE